MFLNRWLTAAEGRLVAGDTHLRNCTSLEMANRHNSFWAPLCSLDVLFPLGLVDDLQSPSGNISVLLQVRMLPTWTGPACCWRKGALGSCCSWFLTKMDTHLSSRCGEALYKHWLAKDMCPAVVRMCHRAQTGATVLAVSVASAQVQLCRAGAEGCWGPPPGLGRWAFAHRSCVPGTVCAAKLQSCGRKAVAAQHQGWQERPTGPSPGVCRCKVWTPQKLHRRRYGGICWVGKQDSHYDTGQELVASGPRNMASVSPADLLLGMWFGVW